ncbi:MAG: cytochrome P460 family protein [Acidobacteria bacterium]|nr:cytochrome P460 family protein [Acidobacteriota bacterium]
MKFRFAICTLVACTAIVFSQAPPAPTEDRVGFPKDYKSAFTKLLTFDRPDNGQIRVIWGNDIASNTPLGDPYPYGSVLLFESYSSKRGAGNVILLDENGRFMPDQLTTIFVKRKEAGFGEAYQQNRNGEWEYVAYLPDGSFQTPPQNSGNCAICHLQAGAFKDFTFRRDRIARQASGAAPLATISNYAFVPGNLVVPKGTVITWYNDDEIAHTISLPQAAVTTSNLDQGATFQFRFEQPGEYDVRCTIHAGMRAKIIVQ